MPQAYIYALADMKSLKNTPKKEIIDFDFGKRPGEEHTKSKYDTAEPRAFIRVSKDATGTTNITNSEIAYLGYSCSRCAGLSYYGGDGSTFTDPVQYMNIDYSISSSTPLNIYFVPSNKEHSKIADGESFTHYPSCQKESVYRVSDSCDSIGQNGGIILVNTDYENRATVNIDLEYSYEYSTQSLFTGEKISYYNIDDEQCVVLEATAGKYGFPGYDSTTGRKIAVDPITKEYYSLN